MRGRDQQERPPSASADAATAPDADASPAAVDPAGAGEETASALERHFSMLFSTATTAHGPRKKNHFALTVQGRVYNFLERPTGWKCFLYHFTV